MIGNQILNYKVKSLIGDGGMGTVYLAEHVKLGRKVAIKVLHSHLASNESIRQRFVNEAKTMSELQHSNIVSLIDYHEDQFGLYLIMECIEGIPLDEYINSKSGPIPEEQAIELFKHALSAFDYAHKKGVVHRDIKPSNLMVTSNNSIKVLDFGIAKLVGNANYKLTKTGVHTGTVYYMSPEQVKGQEVDQRSDIYSLGITFYQMLTGYNPYSDLTTEYEIFENIVKVPLADPRTIYPAVSEKMCNILKKSTEKDPASRFANCKEFLLALDQEIFKHDSDAKSTVDLGKTIVSDTTNHQYPYPKEKSKPYWLLVLIPLFLGAAGFGIWYFSQTHYNETDQNTVALDTVDIKTENPLLKDTTNPGSPQPKPTSPTVVKTDSVTITKKDPNAPIPFSVSAGNLTDFRNKLKQKSNALMKNKNYRPANCSFNPSTFTFRCTLVPEGTSFTKITLVYAPTGNVCESCVNTLSKNPGSEILLDVSDASFQYNLIAIAE
jgi:serine/threonine protein kinase